MKNDYIHILLFPNYSRPSEDSPTAIQILYSYLSKILEGPFLVNAYIGPSLGNSSLDSGI